MSRSTRITLICHAKTTALKSVGFAADESLLDEEDPGVIRIRTWLPHFDRLSSAPELRARQTAALLTPEFSLDPALRDIDYGRWSGRSLADVQASEGDHLLEWMSAVESAPHGGESIAAAIQRIAAWLESQRSAGGHAVVVTHPAMVRAALVSVLGAPSDSFWKIDARPLGIAELTSDGRRWALRSFGCLPD